MSNAVTITHIAAGMYVFMNMFYRSLTKIQGKLLKLLCLHLCALQKKDNVA